MDQSEEGNLRQQLEQLREKLLEREREEAEFRDRIVELGISLGRMLARAMIRWLEARSAASASKSMLAQQPPKVAKLAWRRRLLGRV